MTGRNNILITTSSFDVEHNACLKKLSESGFNVHINPFGRRLGEDEVRVLIRDLNPIGMIAGVEPLTSKVLQEATNLKVISRCGTGIENVDLDAAKKMGITVINTPDAPVRAVAELTLGSILNLLRHISVSDRLIRRGDFSKPMGRLLAECTVGIIGFGRIGREVARLCQAFQAKILAYDTNPAIRDDTVRLTDLDNLLEQADIVTLHLPDTGDNSYLLDRTRLKKMKKGAYLINNARGSLIDEQALFEVLKNGHLTGAALDVYTTEPYRGNLTELENVVLTAHIGSYAREVRQTMEAEAACNLLNELEKLKIV